MNRRTALEWLVQVPLASRLALGQSAPDSPPDYVCPMDPDIRSPKPGSCSRCGMKLVLGIPDGAEYPMTVTVSPKAFRAGDRVELIFRIADPKTGRPVEKFEVIHERLFHMFIVGQDLSFFRHDHPVLGADNVFRYSIAFPKPGLYRILGDFYPAGGTPQLIAKTVLVPGAPGSPLTFEPPTLLPDPLPQRCANLDVELVTDPVQPISGVKTLLFFKLNPAEGLEKYLGAWGHLLAASDDLIDLIHTHPFIAEGGAKEQFNLIFPRARTYRIWVQFQRLGVVNTAAFNVPVSELK